MSVFSEDEIAVLIEALESWVDKDSLGNVMGTLIGGMLMKEDAEGKAKWEAAERERAEEQRQAKQLRKERAVLIQAKLIGMKDRAFAEGVRP